MAGGVVLERLLVLLLLFLILILILILVFFGHCRFTHADIAHGRLALGAWGIGRMTDSRAALVGWLQDEFTAEQRDGFPRLKRVPDTRVIRFLDHFASLGPAEKTELVGVLADWSSYHVSGAPLPQSTYEPFVRATAFPDRAEGIRYTGVSLLAGLAKGASHGGLAGWFQTRGVTGLAMQPPENLLRDATDLVPVKIPTLRRMVNTAFARLFAPQATETGDGIWRYDGVLAESSLKLLLRFSGSMGRPQLHYAVEVRGQDRAIVAPDFCFESLLGVGFGRWDYLTQENADRSVALLCELVEYVARLPGRLPEGCCEGQEGGAGTTATDRANEGSGRSNT
jgi:hypothetical protein